MPFSTFKDAEDYAKNKAKNLRDPELERIDIHHVAHGPNAGYHVNHNENRSGYRWLSRQPGHSHVASVKAVGAGTETKMRNSQPKTESVEVNQHHNSMNSQALQSLASAYTEVAEAYNLSRNHIVYHDAQSAEFAKHYVKGHKGEHRPIGLPSEKEEKDAEHFENTYRSHHTRVGFGGSGSTVYTHKQTGEQYEVNRRANGKGFDGTDHSIRKL